MNVSQLIELLKGMPQDAEAHYLFDGFCTPEVAHVWVSKEGEVIMTDAEENVTNDRQRPESAPTVAQDKYWPNRPSWADD